MKLYTFLDTKENIIEEVRAKNHDEAVGKANGVANRSDTIIEYSTDFYSITI